MALCVAGVYEKGAVERIASGLQGKTLINPKP